MRRLIYIVLSLVMIASFVAVGRAEQAEALPRNTVLVIDNSRSTTGRHSLGGATDPKGLRFDAARLAYENVLLSAQTGARGRLGVIVFCGPENCVAYGPMDITDDPQALEEAIGSRLNEAANRDARDNFTDIRTALDRARTMMDGFEGDTGVILLTDGVNDLTNVSDPFSQPENIEANDQTVEIIEDMRSRGADFYVIALTAQNAVSNADAFMAFIHRMAEAGGGEPLENGGYSNVLMATQADLNSKLLQILIQSEGAEGGNIQSASGRVNEDWSFTVPYRGISEATVNITFMPEDKANLQAVDLTAPDGTVRTLYDGGATAPADGFTVTEERSYIILGIPEPAPGEWKLTVRGTKPVEINTVVRFNHNLRLRVDSPQTVFSEQSQPIRVTLQRFDGEQYVDLTDSDIYRLSAATMTVEGPGTGDKPGRVKMRGADDCFETSVKLKSTGVWTLAFEAQNEYWSDRVENVAVEVLPAPTEAPAAIGENGVSVTTEADGESVRWRLEADPESGKVAVSWDGAENAEAEIRRADSDEPVMSGLRSGDAIDADKLEEGQEYAILLTAFSGEGDDDAAPPMQKLDIRIVPDAEELGGAVLDVIDSVVRLAPSAMDSKKAIEDAAKAIEEGVDRLASAAGDAEASEPAPAAQAPAGLTGEGLSDAPEGDGDSEAAPAQDDSPAPAVEAATEAAPTAEPAETAAPQAAAGPSDIIGMLKDNWMIAAGVGGGLILLIALALIARGRSGERMSGRLKVACDPLGVNMLLLFEGNGRVRVGAPLATHPDIAKLKPGKVYDVMSHVIVGKGKADPHGMVEGSETQHLPDEPLITLSCDDPKTGETNVIHVGRADAAESTLSVYDAGRYFEVRFTGNLGFDDLLALNHRR